MSVRPMFFPRQAFLRLSLVLPALLMLAACQMPFGKRDAAQIRPATPAAAQGPCVVLALPASGPYAPIGGKISRGAGLARQDLAGCQHEQRGQDKGQPPTASRYVWKP